MLKSISVSKDHHQYPKKAKNILPPRHLSPIKNLKTLGAILTNYKLIAYRDVQHDKNLSNTGFFTPCGKCTLWGHRGNHNSTVPFTHKIVSSSGRTFSLK